MATLQLSGGGGSLTITSDDGVEPLYWRVTLASDGLRADAQIDLDALRYRVRPIGEFFLALAADWRGWQGARTWGEPPLALSATHDGLGHIELAVELSPNVAWQPDWEASATIMLEAGQLDEAARAAAQLPDLLAAT